MQSNQPVTEWIDDVRTGVDTHAENLLYAEFFTKLESFARRKLRDHHDGEAIAHSVLKTFFRRLRDGQFPEISDRNDLRKLLLQTTAWKIQNLRRYQFAQKRDVRRNVSLDCIHALNPTRLLADTFFSTCDELLDLLKDSTDCTVAVMRLEGYSNHEIAEHLKRSTKSVEWRLRRIRRRLEKYWALDRP